MKKTIMYVDGYNMIGAWPLLKELKKRDQIENARDLLLHELSNYSKYQGIEVIVVFDAQFVPGIKQKYDQYTLEVIFTEEGQTADSYIESTVGKENLLITNVIVATSDLAEQWMIFQKGASRKSANELYRDLQESKQRITQDTTAYRLTNYRRNSPLSDEDIMKLKKYYNDLIN